VHVVVQQGVPVDGMQAIAVVMDATRAKAVMRYFIFQSFL
jgi:hypothetical protein